MATVRKEDRSALELAQAGSLPIILIIAALVVGFTALLPLVQSSGATSTAGEVQQLERDKLDWQARLRLSMSRPKETHYITVDVTPPEERKLPSRFLPAERGHGEAGSSLWDTLFGWLP